MTLGEGATSPQSGPAAAPPADGAEVSIQAQGETHKASPQGLEDLDNFPYNPDFAAPVWAEDYDAEAEMARVNADIDLCAREGDPNNLCAVCDKPGKDRCSRCSHARYCSRECQVADWPLHKRFCAAFAGGGAEEKRPSPQHYRALFFPVFSATPELHWVVHRRSDAREWFDYRNDDVVQFQHRTGLWDLKKEKRVSIINPMHDFGGRRVGHRLVAVCFGSTGAFSSFNPQLLNKSILSMSKPGHIHPALGPIYLYADGRRLGDEGGDPKTRDITPRDIGHIVRFFEDADCICVNEPARYPGEVIPGIRINDLRSAYNAAIGLKTAFDQVNVPLRPASKYDLPIAMAFYLGLSWYIRPGSLAITTGDREPWRDANLRYLGWVYRVDEEAFKNAAGHEQVMCKTIFSRAAFSGSAVVLHGSGKPILLPHLSAFNAYLDTVCAARGVSSAAGFQDFWAQYKQLLGAALEDVPSPYEYEKAEVKDKLGRYHPDFIADTAAKNIDSIWQKILLQMNRPPPAPPAAEARSRSSLDHGPLYRGLFD
ncbi:hypothetical protein C8A05DRAFT_11345 [Staphylotrichum tortipilum]|uniref:MYND-type domain-containing protein n=1 Tax=Staphylotrichum tortipilum TaxID=2831512 RepID=A0AAN6MUJ7_9PEZI|nr:hypothetical protein C8A05DRAFT_11345 [Staphylotrichum longicolle]